MSLRLKHVRNRLASLATTAGLRQPKYIFVHIPKNGGMSIRKAPQLEGRILLANRKHLKSVAYVDAVRETMDREGLAPGFEHARLRDISRDVRRANTAFAVIRNPWSRVVSRFLFKQQQLPLDEREAAYSLACFEAFLEERHIWGGREYYWHRAIHGWYPQVDYLIDESGALAVDILRQEDLSGEARRYFGLEEEIRRRNISEGPRKDYKAYYTERTIQIVADWYATDIETFGFDFDTPATKNTYFSN
ncbi:sulfotransferase family 2 domain-containing protein [Breoghania sp. JC706]|uniref:sulfotransferase family 2 domain-containing protein n=1 Tax=Breoghania sp. JC706 TaxID=3117732 RepID=UPI003007F502